MFGWGLFQPLRRFRLGLLALLTCLLFVPSSAQAGCGDYVLGTGVNVTEHSAHQFRAPLPLIIPVLVDHPLFNSLIHRLILGEGPVPERTHCHGPNCSRRSVRLPARVPTINVRAEHWASFANPFVAERELCRRLRVECRVSLSVVCRASVFRPPRAC